MKQIRFQYQVKKTEYGIYNTCKVNYEAKTLMHDCDPNKTDRENLDDAFDKACELGADPNKQVRWRFIEV